MTKEQIEVYESIEATEIKINENKRRKKEQIDRLSRQTTTKSMIDTSVNNSDDFEDIPEERDDNLNLEEQEYVNGLKRKEDLGKYTVELRAEIKKLMSVKYRFK